jgi:predicted DsbA family dithiol-disulfide isomerase
MVLRPSSLQTTMSEPVSVHVWSDIACPWCFIGKRRFEQAAGAFDGEVTVEYHSFELAPDTPVDFEGSEVDFLAGYKGMPRAQVEQMLEHMTELAATEGLTYDFDALKHTKTLLAHQALHHAKAHGKQAELVERIFHAYFEQGKHVGHVDELVGLGEEVGLDGAELRAALTDGRHAEAVEQDILAARQIGITGVPFYVIDGKYGVSGAQTPEIFTAALKQAVSER